MEKDITGVILAGGSSSRMGRDKALLLLDGRPFISHIASTLQGVFDRVIVLANDPVPYRFLGLETFGDIYRQCGPLGGIHSGLVHADRADIFVSACDTPLITQELIRYIVGAPSTAAAHIPTFNQRMQPLCALYGKECLPAIVAQLNSRQLSVHDFIGKIQAALIPISIDLPFYRNDLFKNFNSPEDFSEGTPVD